MSFNVFAQVLAAIQPERAGAAALLTETDNAMDDAVGITVLCSLQAIYFRPSAPQITGNLNETLNYTERAVQIIEQAHQAFIGGMHLVLILRGLLTFIVATLTIRWAPKEISE